MSQLLLSPMPGETSSGLGTSIASQVGFLTALGFFIQAFITASHHDVPAALHAEHPRLTIGSLMACRGSRRTR